MVFSFSFHRVIAQNVANEEFSEQLTSWTFKEKRVLLIDRVHYHKLNSSEQLDRYRIKDEVTHYRNLTRLNSALDCLNGMLANGCHICVTMHNLRQSCWIPTFDPI